MKFEFFPAHNNVVFAYLHVTYIREAEKSLMYISVNFYDYR